MIKKLLVALDGSNHSLKAADVASTIAAGLKAEVILLCVVKPQELPRGLSLGAVEAGSPEQYSNFFDGVADSGDARTTDEHKDTEEDR